MRTGFFWLALAAIGALVAGAAGATSNRGGDVKRGAYLVHISGCNDCHTPVKFDEKLGMPVPDMTRMLSGHPEGAPDPEGTVGPHDIGLIGPTFTSFKLPFGVVYSANLTPDDETGTGKWTEEQFAKAMRSGKHLGAGRAILPPMPWMDFAAMTDEDLKSVFAYLRTVPKIKNQVPAPKVPQPVIDQMERTNAAMIEMSKPGAGKSAGQGKSGP